jgi:MFS family permease
VTERYAVAGGRDDARWNFVANVMDGALYTFGWSMVSQTAILPVFVRRIGGGNIAVGLLPVLWALGFNLPQLIITGRMDRSPLKKPLLLRTALAQRFPWLLLAVAAWLVTDRVAPEAALAIFFSLYTLAAVGGSVNLPVWFDLIAKLTPVRRRGRLFAARTILGALFGIGAGAMAAEILGALPYPGSYALLFLLAFLSMGLSYLFLMSLREGGAAGATLPRRPVSSLAAASTILREHAPLRRFLVADGLQISATMGSAFIAVHAMQRFSLPDASAGSFVVIMTAATVAGSLLFGVLADRAGHRLVLLLGAGMAFVSAVAALLAGTPGAYGLVFVCAALSATATAISRLPFLAELSSEADRPRLVALVNTVTSPCVFWGVIGGVIADRAGYESVFVLSAAFALAAGLWLVFKVRDPRFSTV